MRERCEHWLAMRSDRISKTQWIALVLFAVLAFVIVDSYGEATKVIGIVDHDIWCYIYHGDLEITHCGMPMGFPNFGGIKYFEAEFAPRPQGYRNPNWMLRLPLWVVLILIATPWIPYIIGKTKIRASLRTKYGLCRRCAYSLAGNQSGTCPECGEPFETVT